MEVLELVVQAVVSIGLTAWLLRRDERRLSELELARAWNVPSFWIAVVYFSPLCLPIHGVRTRRSLMGLMIGLDFFWVVLLAQVFAGTLVHALGLE
jgi:hypothetical protein